MHIINNYLLYTFFFLESFFYPEFEYFINSENIKYLHYFDHFCYYYYY